MLLEGVQAVGAARRPDHLEAVLLEVGAHEGGDIRLVLDEEDRAASSHAPAPRITVTRATPPAARNTSICMPGTQHAKTESPATAPDGRPRVDRDPDGASRDTTDEKPARRDPQQDAAHHSPFDVAEGPDDDGRPRADRHHLGDEARADVGRRRSHPVEPEARARPAPDRDVRPVERTQHEGRRVDRLDDSTVSRT